MNNDPVRLPRKLAKSVSGGVLAEVGRLNPVGAMNITLNMLPLSRVSMTLAEDDLQLIMHDLVEVYNQNGSVGVYRVTKVTNTIRKQNKYELSHGLDVFSDAAFAEETDFEGSVKQYLQKIVDGQTQKIGGQLYWKLGRCDDNNKFEKSIKYDNLMSCLTDLAKTEEDYMFTFDQSTFPWTLNFVARDETVLSEFRMSRNTESCQITVEDADLCTRLYLSVTDDDDDSSSSYDVNYYTFNDSTAQSTWGVVSKTAGVNKSDFTPTVDMDTWVKNYFSRHNMPTVQITINGAELNLITGESYDEMHLGRMCRVALPDYSTTFEERIVSVNYSDALRKPSYVKVELSNKRETAEDSLASASSTASDASTKASSNSNSIKKESKEWRSEFSAANSTLYSVIAQTATNLRIEFGNTASALYGTIEATASELTTNYSAANSQLYTVIQQTATSIRSELANTTSGLYGTIVATASELKSEYSANDSKLYSVVLQTATSWSVELANAESGIAGRFSVVINDLGQVEAQVESIKTTYLQTKNLSSEISNLKEVTVTSLGAKDIAVSGSLSMKSGGGGTYVSLDNCLYDVQVIGPTNNEYTLQKKKFNSSSWEDCGSFSRATSLSGTWSGGTFTVIATPQKESIGAKVYAAIYDTPSATAAAKILKVPTKVYSYTNGSSSPEETGWSSDLLANASPIYDNGWKAAYEKFGSKTVSATDNNLWVNYPTNTVDADAATRNYYVTCDKDYAYIRINSTNGTAVARCDNVYEAVTVTPIGSTYVQPSASMPGTYYKGNGTRLGSSGTYYKGNGTQLAVGTYYPGNGTRLGASGTYYKGNGTRYSLATRYPHGTRLTTATRYKAGSDVTYYQGGSSFTYYDIGSDTTVYTTSSKAKLKYIGTITGQSGYYYKIDSSGDQWGKISEKTVTKRTGNLRGSSVTVTKQGDSETVYVAGDGDYYLCGTGESVLVKNDNGSSYLRGDSVTAYPTDSSGSNYLRGTGVTAYVASSSGGYYLRGDAVTAYPTDSSGSNYLRGDSLSAYPYDASGTKYYQAASDITRYKLKS